MKKMASIAVTFAIFCGGFGTLYAQETMSYRKPPEVLDVQKLKEEARSYIRGEENYLDKKHRLKKLEEEYERDYGGRLVVFDKTGNEVVKYLYQDDPKIDPVKSLEKLEDDMEELRSMNEELALDAFFRLLIQKNRFDLAKTNLELAEFGKKASELSYSLGKVIPLNEKNSDLAKRGAKLAVKEEEVKLSRKYEDLNKILGYSPQARYTLDYETVVSKVGKGVNVLYVPSNLNEEGLSRLKSLSEKKKELDRKQKAQDNLEDSWERGKEKEEIEEAINLKEFKEDYEKRQNDIRTDLEQSYLRGVSDFLALDQSKKDLEQKKKGYEHKTLRYQLGKISKLDYLSSQAEFLSGEKVYLDEIYDLYQEIERYERLYREKH